jgi:hypothetical protein
MRVLAHLPVLRNAGWILRYQFTALTHQLRRSYTTCS